MIVAGFSFLVLFALFLITKSFLPEAEGGWSDPPIFDYFYMLGMGICFSILGIGYTYYSWTLNEEEYLEWYTNQQLLGAKSKTTWEKMYYLGWGFWSTRISAPIGAFMGISISVLMLFAIFKYWFG